MRATRVGSIRSSVAAADPPRTPEILFKAATRAAVPWRSEVKRDLTEQDARELPDALAVAIAHAGRRGSIDARLENPAGRRLLDLTRAELVSMWGAETCSVQDGEVRSLMEGIEAVRRAIEPDPTEAFISRGQGVDSIELLVEMAHDLRSPLTSILFLAETLQRRLSGDINELQHKQLGLIYSAALGVSEMSSNVLELMRGGNRLAEDEPSPFSVRTIFDAVVDITHPMAEEKGLIVRIRPPQTDKRIGKPLAISRVLLNLTTNALKFTEKGFVEIVADESGACRIEFSVRDSGCGINPDTADTIFSPFRPTASGHGTALSGTGFGLALCKKLVAAMGSELLFESKPEWGTRFYFELDLSPAEDSHVGT